MIKIKLLIVLAIYSILAISSVKILEHVDYTNASDENVLAANTDSQNDNPIQNPYSDASSSSSPNPSPTPSEQSHDSPSYSGFCQNVPILMYHHVQPSKIAQEKWQTALTVDASVFDSQLAYLAKSNYQTISLDALAQSLVNKKPLPAKSIVLTFDDGYRDFHTYAYPILKKYGFTANLMITTGLLEGADYLTWSQLKEMITQGNVFAYNHTWSHANLKGVSQEKLKFEVLTAGDQLEKNLGKKVNIFAYPYGQENANVVNFLKENGLVAAVSTYPGTAQCDSFLMTLHRTRIGNMQLSSHGL